LKERGTATVVQMGLCRKKGQRKGKKMGHTLQRAICFAWNCEGRDEEEEYREGRKKQERLLFSDALTQRKKRGGGKSMRRIRKNAGISPIPKREGKAGEQTFEQEPPHNRDRSAELNEEKGGRNEASYIKSRTSVSPVLL